MRRILAVLTCLLALVSMAQALDIVKDGALTAKALLPKEPNASEQSAADLLQKYVLLATGAKLETVREPATVQGNVISVGHTEAAKAAGLTEEGLITDGYILRTKGNAVFVFGRDLPYDPKAITSWGGTRGTYRAAFGLLRQLGFRWLAPGEKGTYAPTGKTLTVADDLNVVHRPPFLYSMSRFDRWQDWSWANGFGLPIRLYTQGGHTWEPFVPAALWDEHPEYFAMDANGNRIKPKGHNHYLCPTNPGVIKLLADGLRQQFDAGFDIVQLGQSDGFWPCRCPNCKALGEGFETEQVHVCHAKAMEAVHQTHPDKTPMMIVYGPTKTPSRLVKTYPPNTLFELASSDDDFVRRWSPLAPRGATVYVYYFGTWQRRGLLPKQGPHYMCRELARLHERGIKGIYWCGGMENWGAEGPTYYAVGCAMRDANVSADAALTEYCHLLFGKAGPVMVQYYRHIHGRLGRDDGGLSLNEALVKNYPPNVLEKADALLGQAKALAQGDERASNWLRLVDYAHRHFRLLAQVVHLYNAYETSRTVENLKQMQPAVAAVNAFAAEVEGLDKADPAFVRSYFPNYAIWKKDVRSNANQIGSPFKWDFDAILASNMLPGRDRNSTAIPRAAKAPVLDGKLDDEVWKQTPAQKLHEIGMGKVAAETTVRLAFDEQALYVAFECAEPLIEQMGVRECQRDGPVWRTECVEVVLDPFAEGTKMMHFIATPSATGIYDGRRGYIDDPLHPLVLKGQEDVSWNPEWRHAFTIEKERKVWTIEMAFPFTTLGVPAPAEGARWRVNFARERNRSDWPGAKAKSEPQEVYLWSPNLQKVSIIDETAFGDMYFVRKP